MLQHVCADWAFIVPYRRAALAWKDNVHEEESVSVLVIGGKEVGKTLVHGGGSATTMKMTSVEITMSPRKTSKQRRMVFILESS